MLYFKQNKMKKSKQNTCVIKNLAISLQRKIKIRTIINIKNSKKMTTTDKTLGLQEWVNDNNFTTETISDEAIIEFIKNKYRYYNYVDSIEEAEQLYNESIEDRDEWLELRALDTPERIETFIVKGEEFEGYARYDETYTVEIVGIADRQGGEEQFYMIDVSHR